MLYKRSRYSGLITPASYAIDLLVINLAAYLLPINFNYPILFHCYISLAWIVIALQSNFYKVFRYTKIVQILLLLFTQFVFYFLMLYAFIGFFKQPNISRIQLGNYFVFCFLAVAVIKFAVYYFLIKYRSRYKGNIRKVIVIGKNKKADQLIEIFNGRTDFGYEFKKQFSLKEKETTLDECFDYVANNDIDEIYCSVSELSNREMLDIIDFADNNLRTIKFLPDNKNIYTKRLKFEYYDYLPILSLRDIPLEDSVNAFIKRLFDIVFSSFMIVFVLSWLTPLIGLLITLESKGPIFFKQMRSGLGFNEFACYKFRSMAPNKDADKQQATKQDHRITAVGKFIRKTSIDELPQFFNVFLGEMSVVGPRPHMISHTETYSRKVNKFMVRHFVKPGITGLAQVRGYRGEIEDDSDIINRVKLDIFYIENWSLFLDIKIILQTVLNAFRGEEKAY